MIEETDIDANEKADSDLAAHNYMRNDQQLRAIALEHARGAPHKLGSEIIADAKAFYHFLTTKDPLRDEMPKKDEKAAGPLEYYGDAIFQSASSERPAAGAENATVSPPGVPVMDLPHTDPEYPGAEVNNPSPSGENI